MLSNFYEGSLYAGMLISISAVSGTGRETKLECLVDILFSNSTRGFSWAVDHLLELPNVDISSVGHLGRTALWWAADTLNVFNR